MNSRLVLEVVAVTTAFTPGSFSAAEVSIDLMRACGVRAAQHLADQLAGHGEVGAEAGAARHLVDAVGADGRVPTDLNLRARRVLTFIAASVRLLSSRRRRPGRRARSCRSRCSGTGCRPASSGFRSRSDRGCLSSSALAAIRKPGVQMPHCSAACSRNFRCSGCSSSPLRHALDGVDPCALRPRRPAPGRSRPGGRRP